MVAARHRTADVGRPRATPARRRWLLDLPRAREPAADAARSRTSRRRLGGSEAAYLVGSRSARLGDVTGGPLPVLARLARRVPAYRLRYDDEAGAAEEVLRLWPTALSLVPRLVPGVAVQVIDDDVLVLAGDEADPADRRARPGDEQRRRPAQRPGDREGRGATAAARWSTRSTGSCPRRCSSSSTRAGAALPPSRPRRGERGPATSWCCSTCARASGRSWAPPPPRCGGCW